MSEEQERFTKLPDAVDPRDWVLTQDVDPVPGGIDAAPDVIDEQIRRWAFPG